MTAWTLSDENLAIRALNGATIAVFSTGIAKLPHLRALVGAKDALFFPSDGEAGKVNVVVGWGSKPTARKARAYAKRHNLPYVGLEDGFLRSAGSARRKPAPLSIVLDDAGIYYEAGRTSRVERLIRAAPDFSADLRWAASEGLAAVLANRLTKYNTVAPAGGDDDLPAKARVLLVDQVYGDQSIAGGLASEATFLRMIETALQTFPAESIAVKVHPDVLAGRARGYIDRRARDYGLSLISGLGNPYELFERIETVWTVSSQLGLEAAFKGCRVRCFGVPFYAGWGLTEDTPDNSTAASALARRGAPRSTTDLFAAAFVAYANYADPVTRRRITIGEAIDRLIAWRGFAEDHSRTVLCVGFPRRARLAERFFGDGGGQIRYVTAAKAVETLREENAELMVWQKSGAARLLDRLDRDGAKATIVHQGPLPGAGLPASVVIEDAPGAAKGFDNATIVDRLAHGVFPPDLIARAEALRARIVAAGQAGAFGAKSAGKAIRARAAGRRVLLVAEEGGRAARAVGIPRVVPDSEGLARTVRAQNPDAFIVAACHPCRLGDRLVARGAGSWKGVDMIIDDVGIGPLYDQIDAVHVIQSPIGFEALVHGKPVTCWGAPFFAGWGLTEDHAPIPGRMRRLTLDELVAAALILVPRYVDPETGVFCEVEAIVERLLEKASSGAGFDDAALAGAGNPSPAGADHLGMRLVERAGDAARELARLIRSLG